jgi:hypothetical protein
MQLYLCSTIGEIRHRLAFPRDPLEIFQIVNLYRPQDWRFCFRFDIDGKVILEIEFGLDENPLPAVQASMLPLLDCDRIEVRHSEEVWLCEWQRGANDKAEKNTLEFISCGSAKQRKPAIRLTGFAGTAFPHELSDWDGVKTYLHKNTWLGSYALQRQKSSIEVVAFDNVCKFKSYSLVDEKLQRQRNDKVPTLVLQTTLGSPAIGEAHLLSTASDSDLAFRWTHSGSVALNDLQRHLGIDLSKWPIRGELEITFPSRVLGPDGTLAMDEGCQSIVSALENLKGSLAVNPKVLHFSNECNEFQKKLSAQRINQRKDKLLRTQFAYWKDRLVYKVPTSEMETVSLHQKLEGMGGLPFTEFESLEYTPKLGIDAIVNFRIWDTEALHRFATVEFEFRFDNFFAHAHPVEQTDMIICWDGVGTVSKQWHYKADINKPWLGYLHVNGKVIKVAQVSKYPGLTFKGI